MKIVGHSDGKRYGISFREAGALDQVELAALIATTIYLTELTRLPGFDPTQVEVRLVFPSGHVGVAQLTPGEKETLQ